MSFFSAQFPICLLIAVLLYYLLPKKTQWLFLLAVSLGFYAMGGWKALAYLGFTAATTYATGLLLCALNQKAKNGEIPAKQCTAEKRAVLIACLILNIGLLFFVKYWNFTAELLQKTGLPDLSFSGLFLPLGLSFYMFQSIGYTVDCYRGKQQAQRNPLKYLLFVSFFPQMIQGPISRYNQLAPQLTAEHPFDAENLRRGIQLVLWGYLKKLLLADRAAVAARAVFDAPDQFGGFFCAFAVLLYCIQLYCDFSGGIDITRGVAQMFGIEMVDNFRRPIFAVSLADYWRRWHITLGTWMRDYVFYPLAFSKPMGALSRRSRKLFGGKLGKVIPTACATFTVYLLIGIWHGANFRYIFFGFYNGAIMTASVLLEATFVKWRKGLRADEHKRLFHAFRLLRTMALVFVGRYFTRAPRLLVAFEMLKKTLLHPCLYQLRNGALQTLGLQTVDYAVLLVGVIVLLFAEWRQERGVGLRDALAKQHAVVQWLAIALPLALLLWTLAFSGSAVDVNLIYQQF